MSPLSSSVPTPAAGTSAGFDWHTLKIQTDHLPRAVLHAAVEALAAEPASWRQLADQWSQWYPAVYDRKGYEHVFAVAVLLRAWPGLGPEHQRGVAGWLVEAVSQAEDRVDEMFCEFMIDGCGHLEPDIIVPPAIDKLVVKTRANQADLSYLWSIVELAVEASDRAVQARAQRLCFETLQDYARRNDPNPPRGVTELLSGLGCTEALPLMEKLLQEKPLFPGDLRRAVQKLKGKADTEAEEAEADRKRDKALGWALLAREWRQLRQWYLEQDVESDESLRDRSQRHCDQLIEAYRGSVRLTSRDASQQRVFAWLAGELLANAWRDTGTPPERLDAEAVREVMTLSWPQHLPMPESVLAQAGPAVRECLMWLSDEGVLADPAALLAAANEAWPVLVQRASDSQRWTRRKCIMMEAVTQRDMAPDDSQALDRYVEAYYERLFPMPKDWARLIRGEWPDEDESEEALPDAAAMVDELLDDDAREDPLDPAPQVPYVRSSPKVGRNDPCPCKSGRKYKKCCGAKG